MDGLQHDQTNTAAVLLIQLHLMGNATADCPRAVVEEVVVQLAITSAELLLFKEECIVHECESVEDIKVGLLGQDQSVVDERVETRLERLLVEGLGQTGLARIVKEVGDADDVVLGVADDGGFDAVEGEEVGDLLVLVL